MENVCTLICTIALCSTICQNSIGIYGIIHLILIVFCCYDCLVLPREKVSYSMSYLFSQYLRAGTLLRKGCANKRQTRLWACGCGDVSTPSFGSHFHPITTKGGQIIPTLYWCPIKFWKPRARLIETIGQEMCDFVETVFLLYQTGKNNNNYSEKTW